MLTTPRTAAGASPADQLRLYCAELPRFSPALRECGHEEPTLMAHDLHGPQRRRDSDSLQRCSRVGRMSNHTLARSTLCSVVWPACEEVPHGLSGRLKSYLRAAGDALPRVSVVGEYPSADGAPEGWFRGIATPCGRPLRTGSSAPEMLLSCGFRCREVRRGHHALRRLVHGRVHRRMSALFAAEHEERDAMYRATITLWCRSRARLPIQGSRHSGPGSEEAHLRNGAGGG